MIKNIVPTKEKILSITNRMLQSIKGCSVLFEEIYNRKPHIVIASIDPQPASEIYIRKKLSQCSKCGISGERLEIDSNLSQREIAEVISKKADQQDVDGIILQLPIPGKFDKRLFTELVPPEKDIDGLTSYQQGQIMLDNTNILHHIPGTAQGILYLVQYIGGDITSKRVLNIGSSSLVGMPSAVLCSRKNATVTIAHSKTKNLKELCVQNDIIISAVGKPNLVQKDMIKKNAIIVDVGINRVSDSNRIVGDVDFKGCLEVTPYITPVPGGVGPFTIAFLLRNVIISCILKMKDKQDDVVRRRMLSLISNDIFDSIYTREIDLKLQS